MGVEEDFEGGGDESVVDGGGEAWWVKLGDGVRDVRKSDRYMAAITAALEGRSCIL